MLAACSVPAAGSNEAALNVITAKASASSPLAKSASLSLYLCFLVKVGDLYLLPCTAGLEIWISQPTQGRDARRAL